MGCSKNGCIFFNYRLPVLEEENMYSVCLLKPKWLMNRRLVKGGNSRKNTAIFGALTIVLAHLDVSGLRLMVRLHQNVLADLTWICYYIKIMAVISAYICSICLGFQGRKKYFITQLKQIIQISEIFWSHCDCMLRACRKGIKVIFETVLFLEWTLSSKYMTSHMGLKL